jgi:hypothetical protein
MESAMPQAHEDGLPAALDGSVDDLRTPVKPTGAVLSLQLQAVPTTAVNHAL